MKGAVTTLTERGQVSMPSVIRRQLNLRPGQPLLWRRVSDRELRVTVPRKGQGSSMRGFMKKYLRRGPGTTAAWIRLLREGEGR